MFFDAVPNSYLSRYQDKQVNSYKYATHNSSYLRNFQRVIKKYTAGLGTWLN